MSALRASLRSLLTPFNLVVAAAQIVLLGLFLVDWKLPVVVMAAILITIVLLDRPVVAVAMMLAARLISTGSMSFLNVGGITIGLFEPVLLYALVALGLRAVFTRHKLWRWWPWQLVFGAILLWRVAGLTWSLTITEGLKDCITLCVVIATSTVIMAFLETWEDVKLAIYFWIGACVLIGILAIFGDLLGLTDYSSTWKAASRGGRETGLGQQPNWFAMNLMFVIIPAAAMALIQKELLLRWAFLVATLFIYFTTMTSGSRGGAYSVVIGAGIVALGQPLFRKWAIRFGALGFVMFLIAWFGNLGDIGKGLNRIVLSSSSILEGDVRGMNWAACIQMFVHTDGLGIGTGGYVAALKTYSWWLYNSVYRYPHGIFWSEMSHGGIIGVILLFTLVGVIGKMSMDTIRMARGTEAEPLAWAMPASMAGYFAWSFVEFELDEKPFWEWLAVYTALHLVLRKVHAEGKKLPEWKLGSGEA